MQLINSKTQHQKPQTTALFISTRGIQTISNPWPHWGFYLWRTHFSSGKTIFLVHTSIPKSLHSAYTWTSLNSKHSSGKFPACYPLVPYIDFHWPWLHWAIHNHWWILLWARPSLGCGIVWVWWSLWKLNPICPTRWSQCLWILLTLLPSVLGLVPKGLAWGLV